MVPYYSNTNPSQDLYHYGMPRRSGRYPWGSGKNPYQSAVKDALKGKRRSDYFTSERTIPKGTRMFRTTAEKTPGFSEGKSTYATYLDPDRDLYKGIYIKNRTNSDVTYEHEMILEKDLKIPSRQTYKNTIADVIDKNPNLLKSSVESYWEELIPKNSWDYHYITWDYDENKRDTSLWDLFVRGEYNAVKNVPVVERWSEIAISLGKADKLKEAIIKDLKRKGYNAMVDEASVGGGDSVGVIEGIDPLIIFDSSILNVNKTKKITKIAEKSSKKRFNKWASSARKKGNW